jgi:hypothetical protein
VKYHANPTDDDVIALVEQMAEGLPLPVEELQEHFIG